MKVGFLLCIHIASSNNHFLFSGSVYLAQILVSKRLILCKSILFQTAKFLLKFGYFDVLKESNSAGANDPSSPAFINAVRRLQRFGNIPVTGIIDSKTLELISKSRCGVKDPSLPSSRRKRSVGEFNLQGTKWKKLVCPNYFRVFIHVLKSTRSEEAQNIHRTIKERVPG